MQDTLNLQHKSPERWKWYPGYEGIAQVSTRGQVQTVDRWVVYKNGRKRFFKGRILKPQRTKDGYLIVHLRRDGKVRNVRVHRMVAETFIPNPEGKPQVHHRNEQKDMNFVENLSWASAKENINFGTGIERRTASQSKSVQALDPNTGVVVFEFPSIMEAGRKGFDQGNVAACCNGKRLSHRGLVWRYKDDYDRENAWTPVKIGSESIAASLSKSVQAVDPKTGAVVMEFQSTQEAGRKGFTQGSISACCRGEHRTHKGFAWRYKES